jgi:hypothetical protein
MKERSIRTTRGKRKGRPEEDPSGLIDGSVAAWVGVKVSVIVSPE